MQEVSIPIKINIRPIIRTGEANRVKFSLLRATARPIIKIINPIIIRAMLIWFVVCGLQFIWVETLQLTAMVRYNEQPAVYFSNKQIIVPAYIANDSLQE